MKIGCVQVNVVIMIIYLLFRVDSFALSPPKEKRRRRFNLSQSNQQTINYCRPKKGHVNLNLRLGNSTIYKDFPVVLLLTIENVSFYYNDNKIKEFHMDSLSKINKFPTKSKNTNICLEKCFEIMVSNDVKNPEAYDLEYLTICLANLPTKLKYVSFFRKMQGCYNLVKDGNAKFDIRFVNNETISNNNNSVADSSNPKSELIGKYMMMFENNQLEPAQVEKVELENSKQMLTNNVKDIMDDYKKLNKALIQTKNVKVQTPPNPLEMPKDPVIVKEIDKIKDVIEEEELIKNRLLAKYKRKLIETKNTNNRLVEKDEIINLIAENNQKVRQKFKTEIASKEHEAKEEKLVNEVTKKYKYNARKEREQIKEKIKNLINKEKDESTKRGRELLIRITNMERKIPFDYRLCTNKHSLYRNKTEYKSQLCKEIFSPDLQKEHNCNMDENFCAMCCSDHSFTNSLPSEYCENDCLGIVAKVNVVKKKKCLEKKLKAAKRNVSGRIRPTNATKTNSSVIRMEPLENDVKDSIGRVSKDKNSATSIAMLEKNSKIFLNHRKARKMKAKIHSTTEIRKNHKTSTKIQGKSKISNQHQNSLRSLSENDEKRKVDDMNDEDNDQIMNFEDFKKLYYKKYTVKDF